MTDLAAGSAETPEADPREVRAVRRAWHRLTVALGLGMPLLLFAHYETVLETVDTWSRLGTYKYAWLVLPTFAYLIWHHRRRLAPLTPQGTALGIGAALLCVLFWSASEVMNVSEGRQFALVGSIAALVLAATGWALFRVLLPLLALLLLLVPTGNFLLGPLKTITVAFIEGYARLLGLTFTHDVFAVHVEGQRYVVIDDCAGLPYVLTGIFIGLTLALLAYRRWWKIAAFTLFASALAILANGLRVIGIVAYDHAFGTELSLHEHSYFELPAVGVSLVLLLLAFARLRPDVDRRPEMRWLAIGHCSGRKQTLTVGATLALLVLGPLVWWGPGPAASQNTGSQLPAQLGDWTKQDAPPDWHPSAGVAAAPAAVYARAEQSIGVFVAEAKSPRQKIGGGGVSLVGGSGWMPADHDQVRACGSDRCFTLNRQKVLLRDSRRVRYIYSLYTVGSRAATSVLGFRAQRAFARIAGAPAPARLIVVLSESENGLPAKDLGALIQVLIEQGQEQSLLVQKPRSTTPVIKISRTVPGPSTRSANI